MKRWRELPSRVCGSLAAVFLAAMMLLTVADVVLRAVFNLPIRGIFELVELLLACTFFLALPGGVPARREHRGQRRSTTSRRARCLRSSASPRRSRSSFSPSWHGRAVIAARDTIAFNDVTADLGLPRVLHWIALLVGVIGAAIAALAMALARGRRR